MITATASQDITKQSGSNFALSFFFLPKEKRQAMNAAYAFCRCVDDIADSAHPLAQKSAQLRWWRREIDRCCSRSATEPIAQELTQAVERFQIPKSYLEEILSGVEMDLSKNRYDTFAELTEYCHRVAVAVGWVCLCIFEQHNERTKAYATHLGMAFQLTNILRDVKTDAQRNRIYLPLEDLVKFGYSEENLLKGIYNEAFVKLMHFEAGRAKAFFQSARQLLSSEDKKPLVAAQIMDSIYEALLQKIEARRYQVFQERIVVPKTQKLVLALSTWMKQQF